MGKNRQTITIQEKGLCLLLKRRNFRIKDKIIYSPINHNQIKLENDSIRCLILKYDYSFERVKK